MSNDFIDNYAQALFEVAEENKDVDVYEEVLSLQKVFSESEELRLFLAHPQVPNEAKKETLDRLLAEDYSAYILNFLYVILDHNRMTFIQDILRVFEKTWNERNNIQTIQITSAIELSEDKIEEIIRAYKRGDGGEVKYTQKVDPSILGGVILKVDEKVIDYSLKKQLTEMGKVIHQ